MKFQQAKYFKRANRLAVDLVVIHTMEFPERLDGAEWCCGFFADPKGPGGKPAVASAHYAVDADSITQCVLEKDIAWHAGPVNDFSIGIEHAGYASQSPTQWGDEYSEAMLKRSAELVADICRRYSIPPVRITAADLKAGRRRGICGHVDVTNGLSNGKGHWDPGPNFPWSHYLSMVRSFLDGRDESLDDPDFSSFVEVDGWMVSPIYVAPVGIGQAAELAEKLGCELPTPDLVDKIWQAADLRIDAWSMVVPHKSANPGTRFTHDGTAATMDSDEVHAYQAGVLERLMRGRSLGKDFKLMAGPFKDVVRVNGKLGLYGWHGLDGKVIQPFYGGHALSWRDYSQGVRLVRRK